METFFPIRWKTWIAVLYVSRSQTPPLIFVNHFPNGSRNLYRRDFELINELSKALNFTILFTFVGDEGYFYENGTSEGPLRALLDREADVSISDWWLKINRLNFFGSTHPHANDQIIFIVPPGRDLTTIEKLIFPFSLSAWILILIIFLFGFCVIFIVSKRTKSVQIFVFGTAVTDPLLNMLGGFVCVPQNVLPRRNFARFILMMFLMHSIVIWILYQGSYFKLMQSNKHHKQVESINEMTDQNFKFYLFPWVIDVFHEYEAMKNRSIKIKAK